MCGLAGRKCRLSGCAGGVELVWSAGYFVVSRGEKKNAVTGAGVLRTVDHYASSALRALFNFFVHQRA